MNLRGRLCPPIKCNSPCKIFFHNKQRKMDFQYGIKPPPSSDQDCQEVLRRSQIQGGYGIPPSFIEECNQGFPTYKQKTSHHRTNRNVAPTQFSMLPEMVNVGRRRNRNKFSNYCRQQCSTAMSPQSPTPSQQMYDYSCGVPTPSQQILGCSSRAPSPDQPIYDYGSRGSRPVQLMNDYGTRVPRPVQLQHDYHCGTPSMVNNRWIKTDQDDYTEVYELELIYCEPPTIRTHCIRLYQALILPNFYCLIQHRACMSYEVDPLYSLPMVVRKSVECQRVNDTSVKTDDNTTLSKGQGKRWSHKQLVYEVNENMKNKAILRPRRANDCTAGILPPVRVENADQVTAMRANTNYVSVTQAVVWNGGKSESAGDEDLDHAIAGSRRASAIPPHQLTGDPITPSKVHRISMTETSAILSRNNTLTSNSSRFSGSRKSSTVSGKRRKDSRRDTKTKIKTTQCPIVRLHLCTQCEGANLDCDVVEQSQSFEVDAPAQYTNGKFLPTNGDSVKVGERWPSEFCNAAHHIQAESHSVMSDANHNDAATQCSVSPVSLVTRSCSARFDATDLKAWTSRTDLINHKEQQRSSLSEVANLVDPKNRDSKKLLEATIAVQSFGKRDNRKQSVLPTRKQSMSVYKRFALSRESIAKQHLNEEKNNSSGAPSLGAISEDCSYSSFYGFDTKLDGEISASQHSVEHSSEGGSSHSSSDVLDDFMCCMKNSIVADILKQIPYISSLLQAPDSDQTDEKSKFPIQKTTTKKEKRRNCCSSKISAKSKSKSNCKICRSKAGKPLNHQLEPRTNKPQISQDLGDQVSKKLKLKCQNLDIETKPSLETHKRCSRSQSTPRRCKKDCLRTHYKRLSSNNECIKYCIEKDPDTQENLDVPMTEDSTSTRLTSSSSDSRVILCTHKSTQSRPSGDPCQKKKHTSRSKSRRSSRSFIADANQHEPGHRGEAIGTARCSSHFQPCSSQYYSPAVPSIPEQFPNVADRHFNHIQQPIGRYSSMSSSTLADTQPRNSQTTSAPVFTNKTAAFRRFQEKGTVNDMLCKIKLKQLHTATQPSSIQVPVQLKSLC